MDINESKRVSRLREKNGAEKMRVVDEFQCLLSLPNLSDYVDKWIAIIGDDIVAIGETGAEVYSVAQEKDPDAVPMIMKVPADRVMLL